MKERSYLQLISKVSGINAQLEITVQHLKDLQGTWNIQLEAISISINSIKQQTTRLSQTGNHSTEDIVIAATRIDKELQVTSKKLHDFKTKEIIKQQKSLTSNETKLQTQIITKLDNTPRDCGFDLSIIEKHLTQARQYIHDLQEIINPILAKIEQLDLDAINMKNDLDILLLPKELEALKKLTTQLSPKLAKLATRLSESPELATPNRKHILGLESALADLSRQLSDTSLSPQSKTSGSRLLPMFTAQAAANDASFESDDVETEMKVTNVDGDKPRV